MAQDYAFPDLARTVNELEETDILEIAVYGWGRQGLIPLWFGEGDVPTPAHICEAAAESMRRGETFYTDQNGIEDLRRALADYHRRAFDVAVSPERITITNSGMMGLSLVIGMLLDPQDEVIVVGPVWPNIYSTIKVNDGVARHATIRHTPNGWQLDLEEVFAAATDRTKAVFVNSPNNPTGWIMPDEDQARLLEWARERGIWVIADEVYHSLVFGRDVSPSLLRHAEPEDKVLIVNSFSKSWLMTGWRLGWIVHPRELAPTLAKVVQIQTSGVPVFVQRAGIAALTGGDEVIEDLRARCLTGRDLVCDRLEKWPRVRVSRPQGAFYAFFSVDGVTDSLALSKELVDRCNVGLAPGSAFGPGGQGFLRLCYASTPEKLDRAMNALATVLGDA